MRTQYGTADESGSNRQVHNYYNDNGELVGCISVGLGRIVSPLEVERDKRRNEIADSVVAKLFLDQLSDGELSVEQAAKVAAQWAYVLADAMLTQSFRSHEECE